MEQKNGSNEKKSVQKNFKFNGWLFFFFAGHDCDVVKMSEQVEKSEFTHRFDFSSIRKLSGCYPRDFFPYLFKMHQICVTIAVIKHPVISKNHRVNHVEFLSLSICHRTDNYNKLPR